MAAAAPRGAALPPAAVVTGQPACGELRVQLFLSLSTLDAASCVRARLCFGGGSGVADSCASVERFAGAVLILPLHAGVSAVQEWVSAHEATLVFESASSTIGEARLSGLEVCTPASLRFPVFSPRAFGLAPLGHVDVTLRLQIWAESTEGPDPPPLPLPVEVLAADPVVPPRETLAGSAQRLRVEAAEHTLGAGRRKPTAVFVPFTSDAPNALRSVELPAVLPTEALPGRASPSESPTAGSALGEQSMQPPVTPAPAPRQTLSPAARPGQSRTCVLCTPCVLTAEFLEFLAQSFSRGDDCRGSRRQLATLLLTASLLSSPNANAAWSLGVPGDWAVELRPARYAFAIWIVLYAGLTLFALFQASSSQQPNPLLRSVGWQAARALVTLDAWAALAFVESEQRGMPPSYLAKCGRAAVSVGVAISLLMTLAFSVRTVLAIGKHAAPFRLSEHALVVAPLSLLAGWLFPLATGNTLTAATAVLALLGYSAPPVRGVLAAFAVAATGAGAALVVMRAQGNPWFAVSVAWGLCAVAFNNTSRGVREAELHDPGAPLARDDIVVFAAAVAAGVVLAAAAVCSAFAVKRKWGPRRGVLAACDGCVRVLRSWGRQSF